MTARLYDISPPITPELAVFPGDTPPSREVLLDMRRGDGLTLSTLRTTVHLGAHADAPSHYGVDAPSIESIPLERYIGPCQVIRARAASGRRIALSDLADSVSESRVLIHSGTYRTPQQWTDDFAGLEPGLVDVLHDRGVMLVGVDTPSVDCADSKDLPAHKRFLAHGMLILEGLVLDAVPPGRYELIAAPLPLVGFDASPVRAILRSAIAT